MDLRLVTGRCQGQGGLEPWSCSIEAVLATVGAYDVVYWKLHNAVARDRRGDE